MSRVEHKASRLIQIENLLLAHPEGLTQADIARKLQVDRSTINRDLVDLPKHIYIEDDGRLRIDRSADLINVRLNLHEALAVHVAARLLATRVDRQNRHAAAALRKLGLAMERWARRISTHVLQSADVMDDAARRDDPVYLDVLEKLTEAWANERKIHVWHQGEAGETVLEYLLCPYFIEPYAVGQTTHVIGLARMFRDGGGLTPEKMRTFKIERVRRAEVTRDPYEIPADFDPRSLLANAWGIWYSQGEPVEVALKFSPNVARRVRETQWHPSEQEEAQPDGSILWRARIAEPKEMIPWIRGWGADCEVLAPEGLRKALEREARKMARVYGVAAEEKDKPIAHVRKRDKNCEDPQYLWTHLTEASVLAKQFAAKIGLDKSGEVLGLLHDLGKASKQFQNYLRSAIDMIDPDEDGFTDVAAMKGKIDHSSAGAQLIYQHLWSKGQKEQYTAQILALPIASHHSGLIDCISPDGEDNFTRRAQKAEELTHVSEAFSNLDEQERKAIKALLADESLVSQLIDKLQSLKEPNDTQDTRMFKYGMLIRYLFSCVIDADRLNTADFEFPSNMRIRHYGKYQDWHILIGRLDAKLKSFENKTDKNEVDILRTQVSQACLDFAGKPKGIYQLKVPTGGGKTLASLRFALNHAKNHGMDRVFYVIPYTSIIDQNADEVKKILEDRDENGNLLDNVVLEHHSNLTPEEETKRQNLLAENWDAPIVFTTQVQFLESLFGSGTRGARRMHQLANSIIIFDEIQTLPIRCIHMFNLAIRFLVNNCGATVVLCTATQPLLDKVFPPERALPIGERIIQNERQLFEKLKRVDAFDGWKVGGWTDDDVAERVEIELEQKGSVLVVVNTKRSARSLYQVLEGKKLDGMSLYHLSTNMCPAHRLDVLKIVREKLERKERVVCVSTQLIEAGVDIDFGSVIRYMAGLDSIIQAAGRCNRHGHRDSGNLWIVNPQIENLDRLTDIQKGAQVAEQVLRRFKVKPELFDNDRLGLNSAEEYYKYYFHARKDEMMYRINSAVTGGHDNLFNMLSINSEAVGGYERINKAKLKIRFPQAFSSASKSFQVIETLTRGVVVPYGETGNAVITELCGAVEIEKQYKLIKRAQRYSVNLMPHQLRKMADKGAIQEVQEGSGILSLNGQYYSPQFGWCDEIVNDMPFLLEE